jgi:hypothetical protein
MNQPPDRERALSDEPAARPGTARGTERKRDAKALTLVVGGMLTILASVITLFVDKLSLPLRVSLPMGLLGIGLAGAASIMQIVPDRWTRPVVTVAIGTAVLMALTFFLTTPHPKAAATLNATAQQPGGMTLELEPDHGRISTAISVSGTGCPRPGGEVHIYFDGKDLFAPATCLADHTYLTSYSPKPNGILRWFDGAGNQHNLTLSPGSTYAVYAQTTSGDAVSPRVTYRVG